MAKIYLFFSSRWERGFINCRGFYSPQSESRTAAAWGRPACLSGPTPSSPPSYTRRRHPESPRLSSGSLWRTAPLWTSSLPASPVLEQRGSNVQMKQNVGFRRSNWSKSFRSHLAEAALPQQGEEVEVVESDSVQVTWREAEAPVVWWRDHFLTVAQLGFLPCTTHTWIQAVNIKTVCCISCECLKSDPKRVTFLFLLHLSVLLDFYQWRMNK